MQKEYEKKLITNPNQVMKGQNKGMPNQGLWNQVKENKILKQMKKK